MLTTHTPTRSKAFIVITALTVFAIADQSRGLVFAVPAYKSFVNSLPDVLRWLEQPVRWSLCCWIGLYIVWRTSPTDLFGEWGLNRSATTGLVVGLLVTLPMWGPLLLLGRLAQPESWTLLLFLAGVWPMGEEILFRGYAFKQLHHRAGWSLWSAALTTGVVFGLVHLGNATVRGLPLGEQIGVVGITGGGGILFAWIFARWRYNLWVPFFIHALMNLWWNVFDVSENALGGLAANLMRLGCVALAVVLTLRRPRWLGRP